MRRLNPLATARRALPGEEANQGIQDLLQAGANIATTLGHPGQYGDNEASRDIVASEKSSNVSDQTVDDIFALLDALLNAVRHQTVKGASIRKELDENEVPSAESAPYIISAGGTDFSNSDQSSMGDRANCSAVHCVLGALSDFISTSRLGVNLKPAIQAVSAVERPLPTYPEITEAATEQDRAQAFAQVARTHLYAHSRHIAVGDHKIPYAPSNPANQKLLLAALLLLGGAAAIGVAGVVTHGAGVGNFLDAYKHFAQNAGHWFSGIPGSAAQFAKTEVGMGVLSGAGVVAVGAGALAYQKTTRADVSQAISGLYARALPCDAVSALSHGVQQNIQQNANAAFETERRKLPSDDWSSDETGNPAQGAQSSFWSKADDQPPGQSEDEDQGEDQGERASLLSQHSV